MRFGVDYSFDAPTIPELKAAGVTFACRYLSFTPGKNLTPGEGRALSEAGIDVVSNWQTSKGFMISDAATGQRHAREALAQARECGMPEGRPIYFSLDTDPRLLSAGQWRQVDAYLDGAASVLGREQVGIYGGLLAILRAVGSGKARWGWQTYAWSGGEWSALAQLQQYRNGQRLGSGTVDYDRAMADDFGQWRIGAGEADVLNDDDKRWLKTEIRDAVKDQANWLFRLADHGDGEQVGHANHHGAIRGDVREVRDLIQAGVPVRLDLSGTPEQLNEFAGLVAGHLAERLRLAGSVSGTVELRPAPPS